MDALMQEALNHDISQAIWWHGQACRMIQQGLLDQAAHAMVVWSVRVCWVLDDVNKATN